MSDPYSCVECWGIYLNFTSSITISNDIISFSKEIYFNDYNGVVADQTRRVSVGYFSKILSLEEFREEMDKIFRECPRCLGDGMNHILYPSF